MTLTDRSIVGALHRDVHDQPDALEALLERSGSATRAIAERLDRRDIGWVLVAGRGSSDNAGRYGQYLLGAEQRWTVAQATPSLYTRYGTPPRLDGALVVAVSASGASRDVVAVVEEARHQGRPTIGLTNVPDSPLARAAEHVIFLEAGRERAPTATRTYVNELAAFALLAAALDHDDRLRRDLEALPVRMRESLRSATDLGGAAEVIAGAPRVTVVGRGFNLATANEIALKLTALTRTPAVSYSAADLIRGPVPHAGAGPAVILAPSGRVLSDVLDLVPEFRQRGAPIIALSDVDEVLAESDHPIRLARGIREWLTPLTSVLHGQLLALEVARRQGALDLPTPDPRGQ